MLWWPLGRYCQLYSRYAPISLGYTLIFVIYLTKLNIFCGNAKNYSEKINFFATKKIKLNNSSFSHKWNEVTLNDRKRMSKWMNEMNGMNVYTSSTWMHSFHFRTLFVSAVWSAIELWELHQSRVFFLSFHHGTSSGYLFLRFRLCFIAPFWMMKPLHHDQTERKSQIPPKIHWKTQMPSTKAE